MFTYSIKRCIRRLARCINIRAVGIQETYVLKRVMHVQSCCFIRKNNCFSEVAVVVVMVAWCFIDVINMHS